MALRFSAAIKTSRPGAVGVWKKIASGAKQEHPERNTEQILCKPLHARRSFLDGGAKTITEKDEAAITGALHRDLCSPSFPPR